MNNYRCRFFGIKETTSVFVCGNGVYWDGVKKKKIVHKYNENMNIGE